MNINKITRLCLFFFIRLTTSYKVAFLFFIAPVILIHPSFASQSVTVDLAEDHVDITPGFDGFHVSLFGMRDGQGDIAVVIRGTPRKMVVRQKVQILGAWVNRSSMKFPDVPVYYDYALSDMTFDSHMPVALKNVGVGLEGLSEKIHDSSSENKKRALFRDALMRNKQNEGLFPRSPKAVKFLNNQFFRADFRFPANVPVGEYRIQTYYFEDNKIKDIKTNILRVEQVGFNATIKGFSQDYSFVYGVLCVCLALFAGWFSNRVRRA